MVNNEILLASVDESASRILGLLLETRGYLVEIAKGQEQMREWLEDAEGGLLLIDHDNEKLRADDIISKFADQCQKTNYKIIVLYNKDDIGEGELEVLNIAGHFTKPFEYEELITMIESVMPETTRNNVNPRYNPEPWEEYEKKGQGDTVKRLKRVVSEQLGIKEDQIRPEYSFADDLGADPIDMVEICMALEEEFGLEILDEDSAEFKTIADVFQYLSGHSSKR